jgi:hypothetical protein
MASGDPSRQRKRLCRFQNYWIDTVDSEYASWLFPDKNNPHKAHCSLCNKTFNIGHGGLNDVKLHCKGKKHFELYCKHRLSLGLEVPQLEAIKNSDFFADDSDAAFRNPDSVSPKSPFLLVLSAVAGARHVFFALCLRITTNNPKNFPSFCL